MVLPNGLWMFTGSAGRQQHLLPRKVTQGFDPCQRSVHVTVSRMLDAAALPPRIGNKAEV